LVVGYRRFVTLEDGANRLSWNVLNQLLTSSRNIPEEWRRQWSLFSLPGQWRWNIHVWEEKQFPKSLANIHFEE